jgi:hypothetical protein
MSAIDLTDRYNTNAYMRGGPSAWANPRILNPVSRGYIHHTAGFYTSPMQLRKADATEAHERAEIDAIALDHATRFGIGPGYVYLVFPSGRVYAVGKWGTHRAHTKGRDPDTKKHHNEIGIGVCAVGNYETEHPTTAMTSAIAKTMKEVEGHAGRKLPWTGHGETPTVNAQGVAYSQATLCPGKNLLAWLHTHLNERDRPIPIRPEAPTTSQVEAARALLKEAKSRIEAAERLLGA